MALTQYLTPTNYGVDDHRVAGDIEQVNAAFMSRNPPFGSASAFPGSNPLPSNNFSAPVTSVSSAFSLFHPLVSLSRTNPTTPLHQPPVPGSSREYFTNYQQLSALDRNDTEVSSTVAAAKRAAPIDLSSHYPDGGSTSSKITRYESK